MSTKKRYIPADGLAGLKENLSKDKISIYDLNGKLIIQKNITDNHSLDLSELASGQYIIQFQNKKNKSIQIIKK